jgi:hypothetical protein
MHEWILALQLPLCHLLEIWSNKFSLLGFVAQKFATDSREEYNRLE